MPAPEGFPRGWIYTEPAPEAVAEPYTGSQIAKVTPDTPQVGLGQQVKTANAPDGYAGIPAMSVTGAVAKTLSGPQPGSAVGP